MMSVLVKGKNDNFLLTKGAPDKLIEKSKYLLNSLGEKVELSEHHKK
jgi:hypothetical protein